MRGTSLKAIRTMLMLTPAEAAGLLSKHSVEQWIEVEESNSEVDHEVSLRISLLTTRYQEWIDAGSNFFKLQNARNIEDWHIIHYYSTLDDYLTSDGANPEFYKVRCAVEAHLTAVFGLVLVPFNISSYQQWLANREDSDVMRKAWAVSRHKYNV